ncbi:MAG: helix-turn-helix domain-containing protein [Chthoniobacterales bacterium]
MKNYRPIIWQRLDVEVGGFQIHKLELHRHTARLERLAMHSHKFHQCLVYLSGRGQQKLASLNRAVHSGMLVLVPAGVHHAYTREGGIPALCLVLGFSASRRILKKPIVTQLSTSELSEIKRSLSEITQDFVDDKFARCLWQGSVALRLLQQLLSAAGVIKSAAKKKKSGLLRQVEMWLQNPANDLLKLDILCDEVGLQRDSLTRRVKSETGLTLTQMRSTIRLRRAQDSLRRFPRVADAAEACGFQDQNYFARWFREQTGASPLTWRKQRRKPEAGESTI